MISPFRLPRIDRANRAIQAAAWRIIHHQADFPRGARLEGPPDWRARQGPSMCHPNWILLASGPSVAYFDVRQAVEAGCAILVVNGGYRLLREQGVKADILMLADPDATREYGREAAQYAKETWITSHVSHVARWRPERGGVILQWAQPRMDAHHFETNPLRPFFHAYSVVHPALQMCVTGRYSDWHGRG